MATQVWDRKNKKYFEEKVLGGKWINLAYATRMGLKVVSNTAFQKILSSIVGAFYKSSFSRSHIKAFLDNYSVRMSDFNEGPFGSFNEFFIRQKKRITFPSQNNLMGSPAEARLSVFKIKNFDQPIYVKSKNVRLSGLFGREYFETKLRRWQGGWIWVFRLCPTDYHRFHFFDSGWAEAPRVLPGSLHSVNPQALLTLPNIFLENYKQVTCFHSKNFSDVLFSEIGALCVGSIIQSFDAYKKIERGNEKGYFEFGASTIILASKSGSVVPDPDLIEQSELGFESKVALGEGIGSLPSP